MKLFYHPERNNNDNSNGNNKNEEINRTNNNNDVTCDNYDNEIILLLINIHQIMNDNNSHKQCITKITVLSYFS